MIKSTVQCVYGKYILHHVFSICSGPPWTFSKQTWKKKWLESGRLLLFFFLKKEIFSIEVIQLQKVSWQQRDVKPDDDQKPKKIYWTHSPPPHNIHQMLISS